MTDVLEPALTKWDKRVLAALGVWSMDHGREPLEWRNAWAVAEALHEYDVAAVRQTLRGLEHLGYVASRHWGPRQQWIAAPWRREAVLRAAASNPPAPGV